MFSIQPNFTRDTARNIATLIFFVSFFAAELLRSNYWASGNTSGEDGNTARLIMSFIPTFGYYVTTGQLITASSGTTETGFKSYQISENILPEPTDSARTHQYWSLATSYQWLAIDIVLFMMLAWYFDNVWPNEYGRSKPFYFFFTPEYWGYAPATVDDIQITIDDSVKDPDVREEAEAVKNDDYHMRKPAVKVKGLSKIFGLTNGNPFTAVDNISCEYRRDAAGIRVGERRSW